MSRELLPRHELAFGPLVFGVGFVALGIAMLSDTSLEQSEAWLWALAFVVVGVAGLVGVFDRLRGQRAGDDSVDRDEGDESATADAFDDEGER